MPPNNEDGRAIRLQAAARSTETSVRVDDNASGVLASHPAHRQLRVIRGHRTDSDNDSVGGSPKPMQVIERGRAIDIPAFTRRQGNSSIQRLAKLRHHEGPRYSASPDDIERTFRIGHAAPISMRGLLVPFQTARQLRSASTA